MEQDQAQFEERFNSLPQDLKDAISSVEIGQLVAKIGEEEGLLLDQSAALMDQTGLVMLGITPAVRFVPTLVRELGINAKKAQMISTKINDKIFNKIRASLQQIQRTNEEKAEEPAVPARPLYQPTPAPAYVSRPAPAYTPVPIPSAPILNIPTAPLEKVGDFSIERRTPSHSPQYNDSTLKRENVLSDLENIKNLQPEKAHNFVEHLLSNPVSIPQKTEMKTEAAQEVVPPPVVPRTPAPQVPETKYSTDPYREQF